MTFVIVTSLSLVSQSQVSTENKRKILNNNKQHRPIKLNNESEVLFVGKFKCISLLMTLIEVYANHFEVNFVYKAILRVLVT